MSLSSTLSRLRRKAIIRLVIYGLLAFNLLWGFTLMPLRIFFWWKLYKWVVSLVEINRFPQLLQALDNGQNLRTKKVAKRLNISQEVLMRRVKRLKRLSLLPSDILAEKNGDFLLLGIHDHPLQLWLNGVVYSMAGPPPPEDWQNKGDEHPVKCSSCGAESIVPARRTVPCPYCGKGLRHQE